MEKVSVWTLVSLIGPWQGGHVNVPSYGILIINTSVRHWFLEYMVLLHMFESHNDMFHTNASHSCIILLSNKVLILNTNYVSIIKNSRYI